MPARNGTGPEGRGPLTGRGLGPCGYNRGVDGAAGYYAPFGGRGAGFGAGAGFGRFGRGRGRGPGCRIDPEGS